MAKRKDNIRRLILQRYYAIENKNCARVRILNGLIRDDLKRFRASNVWLGDLTGILDKMRAEKDADKTVHNKIQEETERREREKFEEFQRERRRRKALARRPWTVICQKPVGHGGFHVGASGANSPSVRWVYDCGASRARGRSALSNHIGEVAQRTQHGEFDLLFICHFDADYVIGLEQLLSPKGIKVDTVFVPYLEPGDAAAIGSHSRKEVVVGAD